MLDNTQFDLLKEVHRGNGFQPDSDSPEDRKVFDRKVERIISLREKGYLRCPDKAIRKESRTPDYRYIFVFPEGLTDSGYHVVEYDSYAEYQKHASKAARPIPVIDKSVTIQGDVIQSPIAAHSNHVAQSVNVSGDVAHLLDNAKTVLQEDNSLSEEKRQDALMDLESLKMQLSRPTTNKGIVQELISSLGSIASVGSFMARIANMLGYP